VTYDLALFSRCILALPVLLLKMLSVHSTFPPLAFILLHPLAPINTRYDNLSFHAKSKTLINAWTLQHLFFISAYSFPSHHRRYFHWCFMFGKDPTGFFGDSQLMSSTSKMVSRYPITTEGVKRRQERSLSHTIFSFLCQGVLDIGATRESLTRSSQWSSKKTGTVECGRATTGAAQI
jgi:hypothetical protein